MAISSAGGNAQLSGNVISPRFASRVKKKGSKKLTQRKVNKPKRGT